MCASSTPSRPGAVRTAPGMWTAPWPHRRNCARSRHGTRDRPHLALRPMCGIVGLYSKSPALSSRAGAPSRADARPDGRPRPGQRRRRGLPRPGRRRRDQAVAARARRRRRLGRGGRGARRARTSRASSARGTRCSSSAADPEPRRRRSPSAPRAAWWPAPASTIEIYKEAVAPAEFVDALRASRSTPARTRSAHTRMATESRVTTAGLAPVLHGHGPVPRAQRLALEPQPPARGAARRGRRLPDRQRLRGRRRRTWPGGCARATASSRRSRGASRISTASTRSRSARATASPCCATRSPASRR